MLGAGVMAHARGDHIAAPAPAMTRVASSKAVGEPPFMLAISAITAIRHAVGGDVAIPATPEAVLRAVYSSTSDSNSSDKPKV